MVDAVVDVHGQSPGRRDDLVRLGPRAVRVHLGQLLGGVEAQRVEQLPVALGPERLAQEVRALGEALLLSLALLQRRRAHREKLGPHPVHVADEVVAGHLGQRGGEAHDDVRVRRDDHLEEEEEEEVEVEDKEAAMEVEDQGGGGGGRGGGGGGVGGGDGGGGGGGGRGLTLFISSVKPRLI